MCKKIFFRHNHNLKIICCATLRSTIESWGFLVTLQENMKFRKKSSNLPNAKPTWSTIHDNRVIPNFNHKYTGIE